MKVHREIMSKGAVAAAVFTGVLGLGAVTSGLITGSSDGASTVIVNEVMSAVGVDDLDSSIVGELVTEVEELLEGGIISDETLVSAGFLGMPAESAVTSSPMDQERLRERIRDRIRERIRAWELIAPRWRQIFEPLREQLRECWDDESRECLEDFRERLRERLNERVQDGSDIPQNSERQGESR